jgi:hypothetical protein
MDGANNFTVVAGNLLLTSAEVDPGVKNGIVESLLFAQLYADEQVRKSKPPAHWYSYYDSALININWKVVDHKARSFEPDEDSSMTLASQVESSLLQSLQKEQAGEIRMLMEHFALLPEDDAALSLYRQRGLTHGTDRQGVFSIVSLQLSVLIEATFLYSLSISFSTSEVVGRDLFHQVFQSNRIKGPVDVRFSMREWNEAGYAKVRVKVREFLAPRKQGLVLPLSCAAPV